VFWGLVYTHETNAAHATVNKIIDGIGRRKKYGAFSEELVIGEEGSG
jgi:hypothetical protein